MSRPEILRKHDFLKFRRIAYFLVLSLVCITDTHGSWQKNIRFEHLSTEQGLSHVFVHSIAQDQQGFMWFGTANGLNKFDGHSMTIYQHDPDDPNSITDGPISDLFVDHEGVLWAAGYGLDRYDREKDRFIHYHLDPDNPDSNSDPLTIIEDSAGILWIGTWNQGLFSFDRATDTFTRYQHDPSDPASLPAGPVRAIFESEDGVIWVGTYSLDESANLVRFDRKTGIFERVLSCSSSQTNCANPLTDSDRPPFPLVAAIFEDEAGTMWVGGYGLIRYDRKSNSYKRYFNDPANGDYPHINNFTGDLVQDQAGLLWFAESYYGLHSFDPGTETFSQFLHDSADPNSLGSNELFTIFKDADGLIWVASYFTGVSRFDPKTLAFGHYKHVLNDPTTLHAERVDAIAEDSTGNLWVAAGGLNKIDRSRGVVALFQHDPDDPDSLHNNDIRSLFFDRDGTLWLGLVDGFDQFDPETETFRHYPIMPRGKENNDLGVSGFIEGSEGTLWLGTQNMVSQFDPATGAFVHYPVETDSSNGPRGANFVPFLDRDGYLWISAEPGGVSRLDPATKSFVHFDHDPQISNSLSGGWVTSMLQDRDGAIWFATTSGVDRYDPLTGVFTHYTAEDGIPAGLGSIISMVQDDGGYLWFATDGDGLTRFDPGNAGVKKFSYLDGLQDDFFRVGLLSQSGEIVLGGNNGLNIFDPDHLPEFESEPAVAFTGFSLLNQTVAISVPGRESPLGQNINTSPDITLTHEDYLFSVEFAALSYAEAENIRYAYMLEGFDRDWIETDASNRNATYTNLPAGDYVLTVKASGRNGQWSSNTASLKLKILPPLWKTWWAYSTYLLSSALLLFIFIRWRTVSLRRRAVELETTVVDRTRQIRENEQLIQHQADSLEELLHLKEKLYANISHEFRTPLTLILGPVRRLLAKAQDIVSREHLQVVQRNSERLLRLVDQLLELSRLSADKKPTASAQPLVPHVNALVQSFRPLAVEKGLTLATGKSEDLWVNCGPDSLEKILMNLLSNAIKYTPGGGRIIVDVQAEGDTLAVLSVTDTGVGIAPEEHQAVFDRFHRIGDTGETIPGAGIGLALVKELVESFDGTISLESTPGEGTTIKVALPRHITGRAADISAADIQVSAAAKREVSSLAETGTGITAGEDDQRGERQLVLIVEDNLDMQKYLHDLLSPRYQCLVAGDGHDGLELALEQVPDLVVSDVLMPGMDGFELTQALKEDQRTSHIPIIMLTALSDRQSRLKGLREHADDYLIKPFDDEELMLRIFNQLAARDIMKARFSRRVYLEEPLATGLNEREKGFLERFEKLLQENYTDPNLDIGTMASNMAVSTRQLQRKLKALTNHSPAEYLRAYRLKEAAKQLGSGKQIVQVAMDIGFSSQAYFGTCFKAQFGLTPSQFQHRKSQN